jgi:hypothetical protein
MFRIFNGAANIAHDVSGSIGEVGNRVGDVTFNDIGQLAYDHADNWGLLYQRRDSIEVAKAFNGGWHGMIEAHNNAPWYAKSVLYSAGLNTLPLVYSWGSYSLPTLSASYSMVNFHINNSDKYHGEQYTAHIALEGLKGFASVYTSKANSLIETLKIALPRTSIVSGTTEYGHQAIDNLFSNSKQKYNHIKVAQTVAFDAIGFGNSYGLTRGIDIFEGDKTIGSISGMIYSGEWSTYINDIK